jgi:hypothetical protein
VQELYENAINDYDWTITYTVTSTSSIDKKSYVLGLSKVIHLIV